MAAAQTINAQTLNPMAREETRLSNLEIKIEVQPPEVFKDNQGQTLTLAATNNFCVTLRNVNGALEYVLYDESGARIDAPRGFPPFKITAMDLVNAIQKRGTNSFFFGSRANTVDINVLGTDLGLTTEEVTSMVKVLSKNFRSGNTYDYSHLLNFKDETLVMPAAEILNDHDDTCIVFRRSRSLYLYYTKEADGSSIAPADWELVKINNTAKISAKQLQAHPVLAEFQQHPKGIKLDKSERIVKLDSGILTVIDDAKDERVFNDSCRAFAVDPLKQTIIFYVSADCRELKWFDAGTAALTNTAVKTVPLRFDGELVSLRFEPHGNFLLVQVKEEKGHKLMLLEKDTLDLAGEIMGVAGPYDLDANGNLYFVDQEGKLRLACTNLLTFAKGGLAVAREERLKVLKELSAKVVALKLPDSTSSPAKTEPQSVSEEQVLAALAQQIEQRFAAELAKASTITELRDLYAKVDALKSSDDFKERPEIFSPFEKSVGEKLQTLMLADLITKLDAFEQTLEAVSSTSAILKLESELRGLTKTRRSMLITDPALRKSIDARFKSLRERREQKSTELHGSAISELDGLLEKAKLLIAETGSLEELRAVAALAPILQFHDLRLSLNDPKLSQEYRNRYNKALGVHREELKSQIRSEQDAELQLAAHQLQEARHLIDEIKAACEAEVHNTAELNSWRKGNALVGSFHARVLRLPGEVREREEQRLEAYFNARHALLEQVATAGAIVQQNAEGRFAQFGQQSFPVYQPSAAETAVRRVPGFNPRWVINKYSRSLLDPIARLAGIQINRQDGILVMEGEAGSGKNMLTDIFSHFTNRALYTFPANYKTVKEDLTYDYGFDPERGTFREDSKLLEALQTPGTVIVFDEINTLQPGLTKMLNSLFDYRRALYLPDGRIIKADPSVILIGTMNPQNYLGVQRLSQEVLSRARVLWIGYPPEKEDGKWTAYEAEIMAKSVNSLSGISQEEFYLVWDYVVNRLSANGGDKFLTPEREKAIKALHHTVKTANRVREAYSAFRRGTSTEVVEFVFSLRESDAIAHELNSGMKIKDAIKSVVLPKVPDPQERARVETIIDNV